MDQAVKIDPITAKRPTNAQLAHGINQLHQCFESHKTCTKKELDGIKKDALATKDDVRKIRDAFGIGEKKPKTMALQTTTTNFIRTVAAVVTSAGLMIFLLKAVYIVWPGITSMSLALWKAIVEGRL